jgi:hypothetical protein
MKKQGNEVTDPIDVDLPKADAENVKNLNNGKKQEVNNVGTSGVKNNMEMVQKNSFDALMNDDDAHDNISAAMRAKDRALEKEINFVPDVGNIEDEDIDVSSQGSEFVDATQQNFRTDESETNPQLIHEDTAMPIEHSTDDAGDTDLEIGNREFLRQSWTNMAEDEVAEQRLIQHLEADIPHNTTDDDFQLVVSKNAKKKASPTKRNYSRRAKASHSNRSK